MFSSDSADFLVDFFASTVASTAHFRQVRIKKKSTDNCLIISAFRLVGVTGFEPATTRPPELNFTFSNKFNKLHSSGFYTLSKSCSLPLSGVVAISRVPPVFHASFTTRSKLKSESPTSENAGDYSFGQPTQNFYFRSRALMRTTFPSRTTTSSPSSFFVFSIRRLRASKIPALIFSCICLISISLIIRNQFIG